MPSPSPCAMGICARGSKRSWLATPDVRRGGFQTRPYTLGFPPHPKAPDFLPYLKLLSKSSMSLLAFVGTLAGAAGAAGAAAAGAPAAPAAPAKVPTKASKDIDDLLKSFK